MKSFFTRVIPLAMGLLTFLGITSCNAELKVGDAAPALVAKSHDGKDVNFGDVASSGLTLVFFYPKANTSGCTKQACSLRDSHDALKAKGVKIYGVSFDTVDAQKQFVEQHKLPYTLLADPEGKVIAAFGVPATGTFAKRQAYLFKDGKLVWRDLAAATDKQAADVLAAVDALK